MKLKVAVLWLSVIVFGANNVAATELAINPIFDAAGHFNEGAAPVLMDGKWGLIDRNGGWILPPRYGKMKKGTNGLFAFETNGSWGFVNAVGKVQIDPQYQEVRPFNENYAAVRQNGSWFIIDRFGQSLGNRSYQAVSDVINDQFFAYDSEDEQPGLQLKHVAKLDENDNPLGIELEGWYAESNELKRNKNGDIRLIEWSVQLKPETQKINFKRNDGFVVIGVGDEVLFSIYEKATLFDSELIYSPGPPFVGAIGFVTESILYCKKPNKEFLLYDLNLVKKYKDIELNEGDESSEEYGPYAFKVLQSFLNCDGTHALTQGFKWLRVSDEGGISFEKSSESSGPVQGYLDKNLSVLQNYWEEDDIERLYGFSEGYSLYKQKNGRFGYFKIDESKVTDAAGPVFLDGYSYREGFAPVKTKDGWGYISFVGKDPVISSRPVSNIFAQ